MGRKQVRNLIRKMGIKALAAQLGTSKRNPQLKFYPYLLRGVQIVRSNRVCALITTYIPIRKGFVYLTAVVQAKANIAQLLV